MLKKEILFEGNEKLIFATEDPERVIIHYKDVAMAFSGIKRAVLRGKGVYANRISAQLLQVLNDNGIPTHFVELTGEREQLCRKIEIIPIEFIVRNRIAGSLAVRLGVEDGHATGHVITEMRYNDDDLDDPFIHDDHALALGLATEDELRRMHELAERANKLLCTLCAKAGMELVDMKLEFGRATDDGSIIISDEISPDTFRLWDAATHERLDKDRFRLDLGDVVASYRDIYERIAKVLEKN